MEDAIANVFRIALISFMRFKVTRKDKRSLLKLSSRMKLTGKAGKSPSFCVAVNASFAKKAPLKSS